MSETPEADRQLPPLLSPPPPPPLRRCLHRNCGCCCCDSVLLAAIVTIACVLLKQCFTCSTIVQVFSVKLLQEDLPPLPLLLLLLTSCAAPPYWATAAAAAAVLLSSISLFTPDSMRSLSCTYVRRQQFRPVTDDRLDVPQGVTDGSQKCHLLTCVAFL